MESESSPHRLDAYVPDLRVARKLLHDQPLLRGSYARAVPAFGDDLKSFQADCRQRISFHHRVPPSCFDFRPFFRRERGSQILLVVCTEREALENAHIQRKADAALPSA